MAVSISILDLSSVLTQTDASTFFGEKEKKRLENIKNPQRRRESEAGLVALRRAIGDRKLCDVADVVRDENGKPHFEKNIGLVFNISHSERLSAAAVLDGDGIGIGIDVECVKSEKSEKLLKIARRYFSKSELELFFESGDTLEFYKTWTKKEARAKLFGVGLSAILGEENEPQEECVTTCFLVEYLGQSYVLSVSAEKSVEDDVRFILDKGISLKSL